MKLQVLLHPQQRNPSGVENAKRILQSLGIRPTAAGAASISAEVDAEKFQSVFGIPPPESLPADAVSAQSLSVPEQLKDYVESISIAPRHIYMNSPNA